MNRRDAMVAITSVGVFGGLAGCNILGSDEVQLGSVVVMNHRDESETVDVRILEDGELLQASAYDAPPREQFDRGGYAPGHRRVDCQWSDDVGQFVVEARLPGGDWNQLDVTEESEHECSFVGIDVGHLFDEGIMFQVYACSDVDSRDEWECTYDES